MKRFYPIDPKEFFRRLDHPTPEELIEKLTKEDLQRPDPPTPEELIKELTKEEADHILKQVNLLNKALDTELQRLDSLINLLNNGLNEIPDKVRRYLYVLPEKPAEELTKEEAGYMFKWFNLLNKALDTELQQLDSLINLLNNELDKIFGIKLQQFDLLAKLLDIKTGNLIPKKEEEGDEGNQHNQP